MDERNKPRRGPIGWLYALLRANPYILVAWSAVLIVGLVFWVDFVWRTGAAYR